MIIKCKVCFLVFHQFSSFKIIIVFILTNLNQLFFLLNPLFDITDENFQLFII